VKEEGLLVLKIPGKPEFVGVVRLAISGLASRLKFSYEDVEDLKLAVAEACSHAIAHGKGQDISIECKVQNSALYVSVSDKGEDHQDQEEDMGIFLIRSLMDEVHYQKVENEGCMLCMIKHFKPQ
jgi:serine/threonine-protein kinase RsbW